MSPSRNSADIRTVSREIPGCGHGGPSIRADQEHFAGLARAAGLKGELIWQEDGQWGRVPATPRDIHYPVLFVAPATAPNLQALGFDFASDPHRREAIEAAIRSRLTTATDPITFVLEPGTPKEIRLFQPVFDEFGEMRGFAVAALRADAILLSDGPDTATLLEIEFVDESGTPPLLASNRTMDGPRPAGPSFTRVIPIFGEVFAINASAGPDFLSRHPIRAGWFTALTGLPSQKEQLNPKEHKGVQCLASMTTFTPGVNIVRIAIYRFPSCPLRLCGSKCRI